MSRSRDLFKADRLALRDVVQVWVLSLLVNIVPAGLMLALAPGITCLREWLGWMGVVYLVALAVDAFLLLCVTIKKLIELHG